jgi:hypothetical protein
VGCGRALPAGRAWLDAQAGGFVDEACRERWRDLPELGPEDMANLQALAVPKGGGPATRNARPAAARAVEELVAHHLGRRPKAFAHLGALGA